MSHDMYVELMKMINDFRSEFREFRTEQNEKWKNNEKRWEENEKRWEENERRWEENERRWEENERRWKENEEHWKLHEKQEEERWNEYLKNRKSDMEASFDAMMRHEIYIAEKFGDPNVDKMRKLL